MVIESDNQNIGGFYDYSAQNIRFSPVFLVGPCRSGKSSLGKLLGSHQNVFHVEEDWNLLMLPIAQSVGMIPRGSAVSLIRTWICEMVYDVILLRKASFRLSDHSYIGRQKSESDIRYLTDKLKSRSDVDLFMKENRVTIVFNLAEMNCFMDVFEEAFPDSRFIHSVRNPEDIRKEIVDKKWFDDANLLAPQNKQVFRFFNRSEGKRMYIPFWVKSGEEQRFIENDDNQRALYYVQRQFELSQQSYERMRSKRLHHYCYEWLLADPQSVVNCVLPDHHAGAKTAEIITELKQRSISVADRNYATDHLLNNPKEWISVYA